MVRTGSVMEYVMRYQNDLLAQQYDDLNKKYICACSSSDYTAIRISEGDLGHFEELFLREPMVFDEESEELSILLPILNNNFEKAYDPAYFYFVDGNHLRPALSDEEREMIMHILLPRMGGFTGRIGVHNWSSVVADEHCENMVTVSIERKS